MNKRRQNDDCQKKLYESSHVPQWLHLIVLQTCQTRKRVGLGREIFWYYGISWRVFLSRVGRFGDETSLSSAANDISFNSKIFKLYYDKIGRVWGQGPALSKVSCSPILVVMRHAFQTDTWSNVLRSDAAHPGLGFCIYCAWYAGQQKKKFLHVFGMQSGHSDKQVTGTGFQKKEVTGQHDGAVVFCKKIPQRPEKRTQRLPFMLFRLWVEEHDFQTVAEVSHFIQSLVFFWRCVGCFCCHDNWRILCLDHWDCLPGYCDEQDQQQKEQCRRKFWPMLSCFA